MVGWMHACMDVCECISVWMYGCMNRWIVLLKKKRKRKKKKEKKKDKFWLPVDSISVLKCMLRERRWCGWWYPYPCA
jgi:hypothetical protein